MLRNGLLQEYAVVLTLVARIVDLAGVLVGGVLAYALRFDAFQNGFSIPDNYRLVLILATLLGAVIFPFFGMYRSWRGRGWLQQLQILSFAWFSVVVALIVIGVGFKANLEYSRQWFFLWTLLSLILILLFRVLLGQALRILRAHGRNQKQIVIIGAGELGRSVARKINEASWTGLTVAYFLDDAKKLLNTLVDEIPVRGSVEQLIDFIGDNNPRIDEVWIALPLRAESRVKDVLHALRHSTIPIRFIPDIFSFRLLNHSVTEIAGIPILDLNTTPMVGVNRLVKAVEDRILGLLIITLISPVLAMIAIGVKISSPGPIIFKQKRHGWDGKTINVYKFRTMYLHQEDDGKITQACKNDQRITKFGAFLRQTSLDELPQFFNVLQGKMSIVGPRPHALAHNEEYKDQIDAYMQRHKVKPGITGWAQINGCRGETDTLEKMKKRVELDHYYIENWSLWFDLKIILLTMSRGFIHQNAY